MHASSCSSSLKEDTIDSPRTREHLARLSFHDCSTGRRCACLDPDCRTELSERFDLCVCDLGRGRYSSDEETPSARPFRQ